VGFGDTAGGSTPGSMPSHIVVGHCSRPPVFASTGDIAGVNDCQLAHAPAVLVSSALPGGRGEVVAP
jgi:hypothetical protein